VGGVKRYFEVKYSTRSQFFIRIAFHRAVSTAPSSSLTICLEENAGRQEE
jgi:hypothetical protein